MIIEQVQDDQSAKLLAQANLLRIRRQWDEALTCCMQVLYHAPDNWTAHALIGDIYSDQDRPEEAIQWYCMTLDIRPDALSVREKLSRVVNSRRREIVGSIDPTRPYTNRYGRSFHGNRMGRMAWYWSAPERRRMLIIAGLALAVIAGLASPSLLAGRSPGPGAGPVFTTGPSSTTTALLLQPVGAAGKLAPIAPTPLTSPLNPAASDPVLNPPATALDAQASTPIVRDPNDQALLDALTDDAGLRAQNIAVSDAQIDPATGSITVTFVSSAAPAPTIAARIMRDSLYVARAGLQSSASNGASACTVRCLAPPQSSDQTPSATAASGAPALCFTGTISRNTALSQSGDLSGVSEGQLAAEFTDTWWAAGVAAS